MQRDDVAANMQSELGEQSVHHCLWNLDDWQRLRNLRVENLLQWLASDFGDTNTGFSLEVFQDSPAPEAVRNIWGAA